MRASSRRARAAPTVAGDRPFSARGEVSGGLAGLVTAPVPDTVPVATKAAARGAGWG